MLERLDGLSPSIKHFSFLREIYSGYSGRDSDHIFNGGKNDVLRLQNERGA